MADHISTQMDSYRVTTVIQPNKDLNGDLLHLILDEGIDVNYLIGERYTSLFLASLAGDWSLVRWLLANGALVNKPSKNGETPLHVAVEMGHSDIVKDLLDSGATMVFPTKLLNLACNHGHYEVVKVLLEKIELKNDVGRAINPECETSPLHLACMRGHVDIVDLLISKGANFVAFQNVTTSKGPVFFWPNKDYRQSCKYLKEFKWSEVNWLIRFPNCSEDTRYCEIFERNCKGDKCKSLILDKSEELRSGTPLVLAVYNGHNGVVSLLLDKGASLLINGSNPFRIAHDRGYYNVFLTLFQKFKNINQIMERQIAQDTLQAFNEFLFDFVTDSFRGCQRPITKSFENLSYFKYLKQHLKALKVVGLCDLSDEILPVDQETLNRCNAEIANMTNVQELNGASLFVLLNRWKNPYFLKNEVLSDSMEKYLRSELAKERFPLYCNVLMNRLLISKYRLSVLIPALESLQEQEWWNNLPAPVQENILIHLDNKSLQKMCAD